MRGVAAVGKGLLRHRSWAPCHLGSLGSVRLISGQARVAVVGSGPAGFYTVQHLLRHAGRDLTVDIFERLPTPFGLVRYGVAPDHPEVKNVDNTFAKVAKDPRVRFLGNVAVGSDVKVAELREAYHAVILAYGAAKDKELGIPNEGSLKNVVSARSFVGLYNGLPECSSVADFIRLDRHDTAAVVGLGNVALDVARILLTPVDVLRKTDMTDAALDLLSRSRIRRVFVIGRRGPLQVSFTIKEFREMLHIPNCAYITDAGLYSGLEGHLPHLKRPRKRLAELMCKAAATSGGQGSSPSSKEFHLKLLRSPLSLWPSPVDPDYLGGLTLGVNRLCRTSETDWSEDQAVEATGDEEALECGLLLRSIGYQSVRVEAGLPYDEKQGVVPNEGGRVQGHPGLYCAGWLATGPRGVIADTMNEAYRVAARIVEDLPALVADDSGKTGYQRVGETLRARNVQPVTFDDWERIDEEEKQLGMASGQPRKKFTDVDQMVSLVKDS